MECKAYYLERIILMLFELCISFKPWARQIMVAFWAKPTNEVLATDSSCLKLNYLAISPSYCNYSSFTFTHLTTGETCKQ